MQTKEKVHLSGIASWSEKIARQLKKKRGIISLEGEMGSGKTEIVRNIIQSLISKETKVLSPTFALMYIYESKLLDFPIVHADFYRLDSYLEAQDLGIEEMANDHLIFVEWLSLFEKYFSGSLTPFITIKVNFTSQDDTRLLEVYETKKT